jgi:hypothetical protein
MKIKHLCLLFGVTPSTACEIINDMLQKTIITLRKYPSSRIKFPDDNEMAEYARLISLREPAVGNIIGFIDGVSIPVQCSDDVLEQNAMYNGYYHDTMCNNVFAFAPTGKIIFASINNPGSWHDAQVAYKLIQTVIERCHMYAFCVDQGFPRSGPLHDKFIGPISAKTRRKLAPNLVNLLLEKHNRAISLRQASEWGMRALQGSFSRLKSRLTSSKTKRQEILHAIVLLHNFRTEYVGLNQITTVFNPQYEQYVALDGYDRIARYFA